MSKEEKIILIILFILLLIPLGILAYLFGYDFGVSIWKDFNI